MIINHNCRIKLVPLVILILLYWLTAIGLPPGGSSTVHIDTQTIHRTTQNKQYIEQHKEEFPSVKSDPPPRMSHKLCSRFCCLENLSSEDIWNYRKNIGSYTDAQQDRLWQRKSEIPAYCWGTYVAVNIVQYWNSCRRKATVVHLLYYCWRTRVALNNVKCT